MGVFGKRVYRNTFFGVLRTVVLRKVGESGHPKVTPDIFAPDLAHPLSHTSLPQPHG